MFEPLAQGILDRLAVRVQSQGLRFGFGGIARLDEGLLPGRWVLAEHVRMGSEAVILSRTFHRGEAAVSYESQVRPLRLAERELQARTAHQMEADRLRTREAIEVIALGMEHAA